MAPSILADIVLFLAGLYFFLASRHQIRIDGAVALLFPPHPLAGRACVP